MRNLLSPEELAEYLDRPTKTLSMWRYRNIGPAYIKLANGHVRYRLADVERWLDESTVRTGGNVA